MNTLFQKFLALFSSAAPEHPAAPDAALPLGGMPLASATYLREFAQRLGLEVDDLSPAEQAELTSRLDRSMDFREENYSFLYHEVYQLGHGFSLADASRVSALINEITAESTARAYLDYRENAVAAEALMAAGALLEKEGDALAAARLFKLADARRHRSSLLEINAANEPAVNPVAETTVAEEKDTPAASDEVATEVSVDDLPANGHVADGGQATNAEEGGLAGLMDTAVGAKKKTR
ncbi:hypothetical protein AAGW05_16080 [Arthrobacter sp. LAPM80]|uniref:hypothetical protein n=1 Tax=Arthrobacter sp. LAPM80 TaxID=3141788 RepID=UPI00398AE0B5